MGVQGLITFLDDHLDIYQKINFSRRGLVIDGTNLYHNLYFTPGLDQNRGGEYAAFESHIRKFFTVLRNCEIKPYIVLDGGLDLSDKKVEKALKNAEDRIKKGKEAKESGKSRDVLPRLADLVFRQTLAQLKVKVAQCIGESDQEIAALANELKCPVLSADSDFCIFNLSEGFLPLQHFNWNKEDLSNSQSSIPCRRFYTSSFCLKFGIQHELLPTFAALAGNDYVKLEGIKWSEYAPAGSRLHKNLEGLLCWLNKFQSSQKALKEVLRLMKKNKKEREQKLQKGTEVYQLCSSYLRKFFLNEGPCDIPALKEFKNKVPDWMLLPLTKAQLSGEILTGLLQGISLKEGVVQSIKSKQSQQSSTKPLPPAQENKQEMMASDSGVQSKIKPSVNRTSRPLRQVRYGLLMDSKNSHPVDEIDRDGSQLTSISVKPTFTKLTEQLQLSSLNETEPSIRLQVLLDALETSMSSLSSLPPQLILPVAVTCYWMRTAQPPPDLFLLKILLLGISDGSCRKMEDGRCRVTQHKQKPDENVNYAYNQWMICLKDSIYLNQLLNFPLPEPNIARLYHGTLVHNWAHKMCIEDDPKLFLENECVNLYETILSSDPEFQVLLNLENQQKAKAQEREKHEEENDLHLEEQILVRTRYRTKERHNRCNRPVLARKEECRGGNLIW